MSDAVVVVGPADVRGPRAVDATLVEVAFDAIDDDTALVEERVTPTEEVWRDVLGSALGGRCAGVLLICPTWWPSRRVEGVAAAARRWSTDVVARRRVDVLGPTSTVVELAPDVVVVHADAQRHAIARAGPSEDVVKAIVAYLAGLDAVTIDVPWGTAAFGAELARSLRARGIGVTVSDDGDVVRLARAATAVSQDGATPRWRRVARPRTTVLAAALTCAGCLVVAAGVLAPEPAPQQDVTWLVEGRVAVEIPAAWTVERITAGPGSARVQVISPYDGLAAVHLTQSRVPDQSLDATAEALRAALADEPEGIFVDFVAHGVRAERDVVTYGERRDDRHVAWTVLLDRGVRIAIGCQGAVDRVGPEQVCDRAIRSARVLA